MNGTNIWPSPVHVRRPLEHKMHLPIAARSEARSRLQLGDICLEPRAGLHQSLRIDLHPRMGIGPRILHALDRRMPASDPRCLIWTERILPQASKIVPSQRIAARFFSLDGDWGSGGCPPISDE